MTLPGAALAPLGLRPSGQPALIDAATGETISYRDLVGRGEAVVQAMGDRRALVFLVCHNDVFSAVAYAGALLRGHVVALIAADQDPAALREMLAAYRPSFVAGPAGLADRVAESGTQIASAADIEGGTVLGLRVDRPADLHPDLSVLLSTSGTTGSRKFVRLSTRNVTSNAQAIAEYLGLTPDERPITSLPMHYTFGLSVINSHWQAGAAVVITGDSLIQPSFWETFRAHGCTSLAGVPFSYQVLERIGFRDMDLPSLTSLQQAGGALDRRLTHVYSEHMAARGGRLFVMYGQTEATARIAYVPPARLPEKIGSAGIALPGGQLRIDPGDGLSTAGTPVGEVIYEGPNVMLGYATSAEDLATGDELQGVLRTGDLGYLDADGYLYLVGRSKRIAKVQGHRVNLDEVEVILREHGAAAVVGGDDSLWAFCAFGDEADLRAIRDEVASRLRLHRQSITLRRIEALPLSASGKVDYQQVQAWVPASPGDGAHVPGGVRR